MEGSQITGTTVAVIYRVHLQVLMMHVSLEKSILKVLFSWQSLRLLVIGSACNHAIRFLQDIFLDS